MHLALRSGDERDLVGFVAERRLLERADEVYASGYRQAMGGELRHAD